MLSRFLLICALASAAPISAQAVSDEEKAAIDNLNQTCASVAATEQRVFFQGFERQVVDQQVKYCGLRPGDFGGYADTFVNALEFLKEFGATDDDLRDARVDLGAYLARSQMPAMELLGNGAIEMNLAKYVVVSDVNACNDKASALRNGATCNNALQEFVKIFNKGQEFYALYTSKVTGGQLQALEADWDQFLESSKSQTVLELFVNGWIYKNSETAQFRSPPRYQLIFFHPGVVIENVSAAVDGQETDEALILDVIGFNDWTRDEWYIPSGLSYGQVYNDRTGIEDWGHALSFHFRSSYVLGITDHDGERGYFVSVDLLEVFTDKKKTFDTYRQNFESSDFSSLAATN